MTAGLSAAEILHREQEFHDALAAPLVAASIPPREPDGLERALLAKLGNISGMRVLELGCGTGDLTLHLVRGGAETVGIDLSPKMVDIARQRVARFVPGARADFQAGTVENTGLDSASFDLVVGKWILHHAAIRGTADELARVLRPGGTAMFIENSGLNPALMFARGHLTGRYGIPRYGTIDEHPLVKQDYAYYRRRFRRVTLEFPDFFFARLLDRQIFKYRVKLISQMARGADTLTWKYAPIIRKYSYHVILVLENPR